MEISRNLFSFLLEKGIVIPSQGRVKGSLVRVDEKTATDIESGALLSVVLGRMGHADKLQQIDTKVNSPLIRLQNWNLLSPVLKRYNIEIQSDQKSLLIAADTTALLKVHEDVMERLKRRQVSGKASINNQKATMNRTEKMRSPKADHREMSKARTHGLGSFGTLRIKAPVIEVIENAPGRALGKCESLIEVLLTSMVQQLNIRPAQAAALLTTNKRYLSHILIHGVKGSHDSVRNWFGVLLDFNDNFTTIMLQDIKGGQTALRRRHGVGQDQGSILVISTLTALQPGVLSHDTQVAQRACQLLATIGNALSLTKHGGLAWDWFTSEGPESGLLSAISCLKRHLNSKEWVSSFIDAFSRSKMGELFNTHLRSAMPSPLSYMSLIHDIIGPLAANRGSNEAIVQGGVINQLLSLAIRSADPQMSPDLRGTALAFVTDLWLLLPEAVEVGTRKDLPKTILSLLKKGARDPSLSLQIGALTCLFHLLDGFSHTEHSYAPYIYKTLIFALIENHANEVAREFIISNIIFTLEAMPHVPVGVMVPPIVKQATLYGYNNHDFDFFITLAKHPRLTLRHGLLLVDLIGKICLNDPLFGRVATVPFLILAKKFGEEDAMQEYMERFCKVALSMFMHIESKQISDQAKSPNRSNLDPAHIRRTLIIETLAKLVSLKGEEFNNRLLPLLKVVDSQYAKINGGRRHRNIAALRRMCGGEEGVEIVPESEESDAPAGGSMGSSSMRKSSSRLESVEEAFDEFSDEEEMFSDEDEFFDDELDEDAEYLEATRSDGRGLDHAQHLFQLIDRDNDGSITRRELLHAATMDDECMALMRGNARLKHLMEPKHFDETFKALDMDHNGKITFPEFKQFSLHLYKRAVRRKIKKRRLDKQRRKEDASRPSSRASSVFDILDEEEGGDLSSPEEYVSSEEEEVEEEKKESKKPQKEDLSREERKALALKKAAARKSTVQIGKRTVKLKIKKAAKSVQGDIDAAKKRLDDYRKRQVLKEERKRLKGAEQRKRMRKEFLIRQEHRRAARRKEKEEKQFGVNTTTVLYGRTTKPSLHEGDFDTRQKNSLVANLNYAKDFKHERENELKWLRQSKKLFRSWLVPLKRIFRNYSRDFMPQRTNTIDFDELMKLQAGLTISDWMIFVTDFSLVPWQVTKTQALAIFHYSNVNLGAGSSDLGARRGSQIITFDEFISCLRGIAMGEGFRSLPTSKERIDALGSYMRAKAYKSGRNNKVMQRRMGNAKYWEKAGVPRCCYKFEVPRTIGLKESFCIGLEMVDLIVANAIQRHVLTLVKREITPTDPSTLESVPWEASAYEPLSDAMKSLIEIPESKKKLQPEHNKTPSKVGFGGGFTPTKKGKKAKKARITPLKYGESSVRKLPLHQLRAARASVEVIIQLINDVCNGSAQKRLLEVYEKPANTLQGWLQASKKPNMEGKFARFRKSKTKLFRRREPSKKTNIPYEFRKHQDEARRKKTEARRKKLRDKRQQELKEMLEVQREAYEQKVATQKEKKRLKAQAQKAKQREEMERAAAMLKKQKADVKKWLAEGGKRGGGKRLTHEEMVHHEEQESKKKREAALAKARREKFKKQKAEDAAKAAEAAEKKKAADEVAAKEKAKALQEQKAKELEVKRKAEEEKAAKAAEEKNAAAEKTDAPAAEKTTDEPAAEKTE